MSDEIEVGDLVAFEIEAPSGRMMNGKGVVIDVYPAFQGFGIPPVVLSIACPKKNVSARPAQCRLLLKRFDLLEPYL